MTKKSEIIEYLKSKYDEEVEGRSKDDIIENTDAVDLNDWIEWLQQYPVLETRYEYDRSGKFDEIDLIRYKGKVYIISLFDNEREVFSKDNPARESNIELLLDETEVTGYEAQDYHLNRSHKTKEEAINSYRKKLQARKNDIDSELEDTSYIKAEL